MASAVTATVDHPAVQRLLDLLATRSDRIVVGLAGLPGSGKSTIAQAWVDAANTHLGAGTAQMLGMDGFHLTRAELAQQPDPAAALARRGAPWTFDPLALQARLPLLRAGFGRHTVYWPEFEHGVGDPVADAIAVLPATRLVLVEGLYLLHRGDGWATQPLLDACWFLDVPMDVAMGRLSLRHQRAWGVSAEEAEARVARNDLLNAGIVWAGRDAAGWVVSGA
jgi:pantothenate kinase